MSALITGATGFIGSHIARKLVERGEKVKVLLRKTSKTRNIDDLNVEKVYGDILDKESVIKALQDCDTLYHSAGFVSFRKKDYGKMENINVQGSKTVLSAAVEAGIKRVVFTSSVAALGPGPENGCVTEDTVTDFRSAGIGYMNVKRDAESAALDFCSRGLDVVVTNPSVVLGAGDIYMSSAGSVLWYCKRRFPGYLDGTLNVTDVEDVAEGHILAAEKGKSGERYILGNTNLTVKEYFNLLEKVTGISSPKLKIPYAFAYATAYLTERIMGFDFPNMSTMDVDSVKLTRYNWHADSSKAQRELGYTKTPIEETVRKTVEWFKKNGYLD